MTVKASDRDPEKTCNVEDCAAWRKGESVYCRNHVGLEEGGAEEGNQQAMKTGIHSDPVNLFDFLAENDPEALEYILHKLREYAKQASQPVYEADLTDVNSFEDAKQSLTGHGDDLLRMCVQDYARWKGTKRQLQEGLITTQTRSGEHGTYEVNDSNPVNLDLDRLERTGLKQKNKYDLLPSPESQQAQATREVAERWREALESQ